MKTLFHALFLALAVLVGALAVDRPAHAQAGQQIVPVTQLGEGGARRLAEETLRVSIPGGDYIAQVLFAVIPTPSSLGVVAKPDGEIKSATAIPLIIGYFNMLVGALLVVAGSLRMLEYVMDAGREGRVEAGGMTAWGPIRLAIGALMIIPLPGGPGWAAVQHAVGLTAVAGYQVANASWSYIVSVSGADSRRPIVPPLNPNLPEFVGQVGAMELCRSMTNLAAFNHWGTQEAARFATWSRVETDEFINYTVKMGAQRTGITGWIVSALGNISAACGDITIAKMGRTVASSGSQIFASEDPTIGARAHGAATDRLVELAQTMGNTAFTSYQRDEPDWKLKAFGAFETYFTAGIRDYAGTLSETASQILTQGSQSTNNSAERQFEATARHAGWSNAGSFYVTYARIATSAANVASHLPAYSTTRFEQVRRHFIDRFSVKAFDNAANGYGELIETYRRVSARFIDPAAPSWQLAATGNQSGAQGNQSASSANESGNFGAAVGVAAGVAGSAIRDAAPLLVPTTVQDLMRRMVDPSVGFGQGGWNPNVLQSQIDMGHTLMAIGGGMLAVAAAADFAKEVADSATPSGPALVAKTALKKVVGGVVYGANIVGFGLLAAGVLLAYAVPLALAIAWFVGVLQWVMLVFEAMIVGAFFGLANAKVEGQGVLAENSKHALAVFLQVLIRPLIMTIGIPIGILVYSMFGTAVSNAVWKYTMPSMLGDHWSGPIAFVSVAFIMSSFMLAMIIWLASLPNALANNASAWLGLHPGPEYQTTQVVSSATGVASAAGMQQTGAAVQKGTAALSALAANTPGTAAHAAKQRAMQASGPKGGADGGDKKKDGEPQPPVANTAS